MLLTAIVVSSASESLALATSAPGDTIGDDSVALITPSTGSDSIAPAAMTVSAKAAGSEVTGAAAAGIALDVDGNGEVDGFTDGALLFGYLAGASDVKLAKCISGNATRNVAQVRAYLDSLTSSTLLDVDGSGGAPGAFTDGALLFGYLAGASDVKLAKCISGDATRSLSEIHTYLNQLLEGTTPPVNKLPGTQAISADESLVFSPPNGNAISIVDSAVGSNLIEISLNITGGTFSLSGISGLSFSSGTGTNSTGMKFQATVDAANAAFSGAAFQPSPNFNGIASLQILTSDLGHGGGGGPLTASGSVQILVGAVPGTTLTIAGSYNATLKTVVNFSIAGGLTIEVPATSVSATSVSVVIPAYIDFLANPPDGTSAFVAHGAVSVTVRQTSSGGTFDTLARTGFQIAKLPATGEVPGAVAVQFLEGLQELVDVQLANAQELQNAAGGNNASLTTLIASLQASRQKITALQQAVQPLLNGQVSSIPIATTGGKSIVLNQESLKYLDEYLGVIFTNDPLATGMPQTFASKSQPQAFAARGLTAGNPIDDSLKSIIGSVKGEDFMRQSMDAIGRFRSSMGVAGAIATGVVALALGPEAAVAAAVVGAILFVTPTLAQLANSVALQGGMNSIINGKATLDDLRVTTDFAITSTLDAVIGESTKALSNAAFEAPLGKILGETAEAARNTYDIFTKGTGTSESVVNYLKSAYDTIRSYFGTPTIGVSPGSFTFIVPANGPAPEAQVLTVNNAGTGILNWTVSSSPSNIFVLTLGGSLLGPGQSSGALVYVDGTGLSAGMHSGTITISASNSTNQSVTIPVTINVVEPVITVSPSSMTFTVTQGQSEQSRTLTVSNTGPAGTVLSYSATTTNGFVQVSDGQGQLASGQSDFLTVTTNASSLSVGTYTDYVLIYDSNDTSKYKYVTVTINVQAPPLPVIAVGPTELTFTAVQNGPSPVAQVISISNVGAAGSLLNWAANLPSNRLSLSGGVSPISAGFYTNTSLSVNTSGLAPGSYAETISIYSPDDSRVIVKTIKVNVIITGQSLPAWGAYESGSNGRSSDQWYSISSAQMTIRFWMQPFGLADRFIISDDTGRVYANFQFSTQDNDDSIPIQQQHPQYTEFIKPAGVTRLRVQVIPNSNSNTGWWYKGVAPGQLWY